MAGREKECFREEMDEQSRELARPVLPSSLLGV